MSAELAPGITTFPLPGHFPGQTGVRVESAGETALLVVDLARPSAVARPAGRRLRLRRRRRPPAPRRVRPSSPSSSTRRARGLRPLPRGRHRPGRAEGLGASMWVARVTWPRDDAKLDRVRALMAEQELDALVVRAPDNVLYLTNFWGMKGYDAVVFPREGEPALICLEASADDAERTAWTQDVRLFRGYDERDPRPPPARALELALEAPRGFDRVGLELSLGTQASDRMVGEPTTFTAGLVRRLARRGRRDAAPRRGPRDQDRAGDRAHAARQRDRRRGDGARARRAPPRHEGERGGRALERATSTAQGTGFEGKVELAHGFSLVWSGAGIRTFTATGDRPVQEHEPTLFEIWVCADGYWCDHTKNLCPGELTPAYDELLERAARRLRRARSTTAGRARASPSSTGSIRDGLAEVGYPGQPSHPIAHGVGARAHEPPYAHQAGGGTIEEGMVLAIEPGVYWEGGGGLRLEDNFLDHRRRRREALPLPGRRPLSDLIWTGALNDRARARRRRSASTTRRCATASRPSASCSMPEEKLEIARRCSTSSASTGSRRASRASRTTTGDAVAADLRRRPRRRDLGLLARGAGRPRGARRARRARVSVIESPISDLKLDALGVSRETMLERIARRGRASPSSTGSTSRSSASTRPAPTRTSTTRPTRPRSRRARSEVVVVDTLGVAAPEAVAELVGRTRERLGPDVPVHFHGHNDFGLATASGGRRRPRRRDAGSTARSTGWASAPGTPNLGEVALALRALYGVETDLRPRAGARRRRSACASSPATRSSRGSRSPARTSSVARAARWRASSTTRESIEPYSSELVAAERGDRARQEERASTRSGSRRTELGLDVPEERRRRAARGGQAARDREARARHRRRVPAARRGRSVSDGRLRRGRSSAAGSTRWRRARSSRSAGWRVCVLERNDYLGGAIRRPS